jgi:photosystem II stability/assembly factor-like uncharacterized protein
LIRIPIFIAGAVPFPSIFVDLSSFTMRKLFTVLICLWAFLPARAQQPSFLQKELAHLQWQYKYKNQPRDPGWVQQRYEMKKNEAGLIPRLPFDNIRKHQAQSALRNNLLHNFQELGPYNIGGRTRAILIDRKDDQHILSGSVSGGLFRSFDEGASWQVVNDELTALSISSLAQDFFEPEVIYAGTGEGWGNADGVVGNGVYRSINGGESFEQLPSTDGTAFNYIFDIATTPADSGSLYIATNQGDLYYSTNKGDSLKRVFNSPNTIADIEITPTGGVWLAVYYEGLYYSATGDSGTFELRVNGMNNNRRRLELAIAPSDTNVLYVAVENTTADGLSGVYRSSDFGLNWTPVTNPTDYGFYTTFTWYSMCIAVKPDDPDFVMVGVGALLYSFNGGAQWFECSNIHADHHAIVFHPENPKIFYQGNDGGVYRFTTDIMYNNTNLNNGYRTVQYYAGAYYPTGINILGGTQDNGTHKCKAGDGAFFHILGGDGAFCAVNQQFPDVVYAEYQNGIIHRAYDGNEDVPSFTNILNELDGDGDGDVDDGAWFINPFDINLVNSDYLPFVTTKKLWHTYDGGASWYPATQNTNGTPYAIGMSREFSPTVYIGGSNAMFYRIDDVYNSVPGMEVNLSNTVPQQVTSGFISSITVHPADNSICFVSFSSFSDDPQVWKVTSANTSTPVWTSISGDLPVGLPVNYIDVDPARPEEFFLAATDFGLYISDNGGNSWYKVNEFPNVYTEQVKVRQTDRRVFMWTHGRGAFTATLDSLLVSVPVVSSQEMYAEIHPNPAADYLQVETNAAEMLVTVREVNGKEVMPPFTISGDTELNIASLASGIYFLEMKSGNQVTVKKMVKK